MARWFYDPSTPETIFEAFVHLEPGFSAWDEAEHHIYDMAWEKAVKEHGG